ncbi:MAG: hypothetical protein KHX31_05460 [Akkermansia sp.]|uniref:hypothetical protein n=1 Tax=Akkermansia sp. TaxID=1872421 RepID=UPI0025B880F5|nr:hypothetical protein [Akkermansia sp.]MBS5508066.1 hypothetical protein [Akkermansia sp.]MCD8063313.1 hypothetical protein [Akkermansia sp.]
MKKESLLSVHGLKDDGGKNGDDCRNNNNGGNTAGFVHVKSPLFFKKGKIFPCRQYKRASCFILEKKTNPCEMFRRVGGLRHSTIVFPRTIPGLHVSSGHVPSGFLRPPWISAFPTPEKIIPGCRHGFFSHVFLLYPGGPAVL